jgi:hypothetical protein
MGGKKLGEQKDGGGGGGGAGRKQTMFKGDVNCKWEGPRGGGTD